jgi:hypothetical protein
MGLTCLGVAGLALAHYRILFFYPCFVAPLLWLEWFQANWRLDKLREQVIRLVIIALGAAIILGPWLWRVIASQLWQVNMFIATAGTSNEFFSALTTTYPSVFDYVSPLIVLLGLAGLIWGSWQRQAGIFVTGGWGLMLLILANPHFLKLPGTGVITYFTVLIAAYLPFSILAGFTLAKIAEWLVGFRWIIGWVIVLVSLVVGLIGAQERVVSFKPANAMVTKPDLAAMAWIRENAPSYATFWANSRLAYGNYTFVGTDAGLWIPFLTGRHGMVLPIIYGTELINPPDYSLKILGFYRQVHRSELASFDSWQTLKQAGITHIYIGQRRGEVWRETEQPIDPLALQNSPHYQNVYHQDQVWIFALK